MEKIYLIVNLKAAGGLAKKKFSLLRKTIEEMKIDVNVLFSEYTGNSIELAKKAFNQNATRIISFGGDGTHYEVINGILTAVKERYNKEIYNLTDEEKSTIPVLGIISVGTGNDFSKSLKLPKNFIDAFLIALNGVPKYLDVGLFECVNSNGEKNSNYFFNVLSGGYSGLVVENVLKSNVFIFKKLTYIKVALCKMFSYFLPEGIVRTENREIHGKFFEFDITNGKYFAAGILVSPQAKLDDGYLNVSIFENYKGIEMLFKLKKLYDGSIIEEPKVHSENAKEIYVECNPPQIVEADGELAGHTPIKVRVIEKAIRVAQQ